MSKIKLYTKPALTETERPRFTTGANCVIEIDGKRLPYCTSFKFEVSARGIAKATIELVGEFEIDVDDGLVESGVAVGFEPTSSDSQSEVLPHKL